MNVEVNIEVQPDAETPSPAQLQLFAACPMCEHCRGKLEKIEDSMLVQNVMGGPRSILIHKTCLMECLDRLANRAVKARGRRIW